MRVQTQRRTPDTLWIVVHTKDGQSIGGIIREVTPEGTWRDVTGAERTGHRWIPLDFPEDAPGPATVSEATAAALLEAGYSPGAIRNAQGLVIPKYRRVSA